ncbi:hypothetical protein PPSIR1_30240 [Plesiocystis pacifica SIR-1]|uniref:Uncharacterized protein n=1 Tax=Plesiocystis pacifica SIR-1 TaxID=391625 RepID=A6FZ27_9BACT|nr:hypothetical protein [Plesiocystis pacifica]EDM81182.1 hypothetical protein PPSIR1_30240 [Plesiocystis pacifica SIR-1]
MPYFALAGVEVDALEATLDAVGPWFAGHSQGRFAPRFELLGRPRIAKVGRYRGAGGLDRWPNNSQALTAAVVEALGADGRRRLGAERRPPVVIAPRGFRPHCWHLRGGGRRLEGGGACHRYALLPADASLGAVAHELGHLLLDWPDLARGTGLERECLMARGAGLGEGRRPAPPCAPLRARAGWVEVEEARRETRAGELLGGRVFGVGDRLVELREAPLRLLGFEDRARPRLCARVSLRPRDLERPLLAIMRTQVSGLSS